MRALGRVYTRCLIFAFWPVWFQWHFSIYYADSWWRHQMETFSVLLALCAGNSPVTREFSSPRPVTRSFHVFFDLLLNKRLSKQSWGWWFETPSRTLWRHTASRYQADQGRAVTNVSHHHQLWITQQPLSCSGFYKRVHINSAWDMFRSAPRSLVSVRDVCSLNSLVPGRFEINLRYRQISNIRRNKSHNLNVSRLVLQLSLPSLLKLFIKLRMKM